MSGIIIHLFIFGFGSSFHPKPGNLWFFTKINSWDWQVFCLEPGSSYMFGSNRPVQNDRTEEYSFLGFLSKSALTRVFTRQIEVFSVKLAFHFSFVIHSFHNDLFSEGVPRGFFYFRKNHLGRQPGHSWQGPVFSWNSNYPIFWNQFRWFLEFKKMKKIHLLTKRFLVPWTAYRALARSIGPRTASPRSMDRATPMKIIEFWWIFIKHVLKMPVL